MQRCSKKAYAMCPTRHLCGPIEEAIFSEDSECAAFNREVEDKPMTNGDKIRAMSDQELAEYGIRGFIPVGCCTPAWYGHFGGHSMSYEDAVQRELEWLQQPAEGE